MNEWMPMKNKIVIIDDNASFTEAMVFFLEIYKNLEILIYHNVLDFFKNYSNTWKGILVVDLLMPNYDGFFLLKELKNRHNKMYTLIISGHADKIAINKAKALGATAFLPKPFNPNHFLELLHQYKLID